MKRLAKLWCCVVGHRWGEMRHTPIGGDDTHRATCERCGARGMWGTLV